MGFGPRSLFESWVTRVLTALKKIQLQLKKAGDSRAGFRFAGMWYTPKSGGRFARYSCSKRLTYLTALLELWHQLIGDFPPNIRKLSGFHTNPSGLKGMSKGICFPIITQKKLPKVAGPFCYMF